MLTRFQALLQWGLGLRAGPPQIALALENLFAFRAD
jgi:hypothetical protein